MRAHDDAVKLLNHRVCKKATYGHGSATKLDRKVRRAWQVDASKVTFPHSPDFLPKTLPLIVKKAVRALGMDGSAGGIEAHLYKLLLYEPGGHFALHRDTEKEPGMFATLILQLPTQEGFEGGELVVHQGRTRKIFDFSSDSPTKFFYSIFFADCEHELLKVTKGKRLCGSFNLVRGNGDGFNAPLEELIQKGYSSRLSKVEAALEPWLQAVLREEPLKAGNAFFKTEKLAIPLQHKYTKKNLSFSGLKGNDRIAAQILLNFRDGSGSRSLDLHLCILTLHQYGSADEGSYDGRHEMDEVCDEAFEPSAWIGTNDKPCNFTMEIDDQHEVVTDEDIQMLFTKDAKPDEDEFEEYTGNEGSSIEYWYRKAMLIIWPKKKSIFIACSGGVSGALDILETKAEEGDPAIATMLHEVLDYCEGKGKGTWNLNGGENPSILMGRKIWSPRSYGIPGDRSNVSTESVTSRLIKLSLQVGGLDGVLRALKLLCKSSLEVDFHSRVSEGRTVGINDTFTATAVASAVQRYGWVNCEPFIMEMVTNDQATVQGKYFVHLALELKRLGYEDAGLLVAKQTLEMIDSAYSSF